MGSNDTTVVKQNIRNEMTLEIQQTTKNLTKVVNESITNISTKLVNETAASITIATSAVQSQDIGDIIISGEGNVASIEQQAKIEAQNKAIVQIISDASAMADMGNKISQDVLNKTQNDASFQQSAKAVSALAEKKSDAGGIEGVVNSITGMVTGLMGSITGSNTSSYKETNIVNQVKTKLIQETINQTDISNIIKQNISNEIKNVTAASCNISTATTQVQKLRSLIIDGKNNKYGQKQDVSIKALNDCLINLQIGGKVMNSLSNGLANQVVSETKNAASGEQKQDTQSEIANSDKKTSAIGESIDNAVTTIGSTIGSVASTFMFMIGGIILVIIIIIGAVLFSGSSALSGFGGDGDDGDDSGNEEEQAGGNLADTFGPGNGKFYLLAGVAALLILLYNKSIPLCGIVLIVLVMYILYKQKTT